MKNIPLRNGDWTLSRVDTIEGDAVKTTANEFIFGEGEVTGHMHTMHVPHVEDMEWRKLSDGSWQVTLHTDGYITHPQHSAKVNLVVPKGIYHVRQAREYDWFAHSTRRIVD